LARKQNLQIAVAITRRERGFCSRSSEATINARTVTSIEKWASRQALAGFAPAISPTVVAMLSPSRLITENRPSAKPELWANLPNVLRRRVTAWINDRFDPYWSSRPFISTIEPEKLLLEVIPGDVVGKSMVYFGVYEYALSTLLRAFLKPGATFVDVGANIGYYTVLAASLVGSGGRVYAFEPSPRVRRRLERNVELNQLAQVRIRSEALTREAGMVRLIEPEGRNNDGLAYVDKAGGTDGVEVRAMRLDDDPELAARVPDLIKVDVEGGEPDVFAGAERILSANQAPSVFFESFELARDAGILRAYGYDVFQPAWQDGAVRLTDDLRLPAYRRWEAPNFVAVKSEPGRALVEQLRVRRK
jgi:FkbM family methyltransferase